MSNSLSNRLSASLGATAIGNIKTAITTIKTNLPFLVGLTVEERKTIPKISESNKVFAADALNAALNNSTMLPAYFSSTEMKLDMDLYNALDEINLLLSQLSEQVNDTQMLAGSEAYVSALTVYRLFGAAAKAGVPGADSVNAMLAKRFANQGGHTANAQDIADGPAGA